jgi:hypothetical protein
MSLQGIFFGAVSLVETEQMTFQYQARWSIHLFFFQEPFSAITQPFMGFPVISHFIIWEKVLIAGGSGKASL